MCVCPSPTPLFMSLSITDQRGWRLGRGRWYNCCMQYNTQKYKYTKIKIKSTIQKYKNTNSLTRGGWWAQQKCRLAKKVYNGFGGKVGVKHEDIGLLGLIVQLQYRICGSITWFHSNLHICTQLSQFNKKLPNTKSSHVGPYCAACVACKKCSWCTNISEV